MKRCKNYCGVACIDGSCPIANRDEYIERGYDVVRKCEDCYYYKGCEDCYFDGNEEFKSVCYENKKEGET